jgi:hypothetical protein
MDNTEAYELGCRAGYCAAADAMLIAAGLLPKPLKPVTTERERAEFALRLRCPYLFERTR